MPGLEQDPALHTTPHPDQHPNIGTAIRYHEAVARGAVGAELAGFFHEDLVQQEFPNALFPDGVRRDLDAVLRSGGRGCSPSSGSRW
ncbi:hypothetical protein [Streptomyces sp. NPDC087300]|uniref:hypothetical protein n=1 Tax=Streptomyces sp. NPDC087300 TaxID=3365780 RepID=UPI0038082EF4